MDLSYLQKEVLGTKVYEWGIFLANLGVFAAYIAYCKKHPDVFDKISKKLGLEKKIDSDKNSP